MSVIPFRPQGPTVLMALTTVASAGISPSSAACAQAMRIVNLSTSPGWITFSATSTGAAALPSTSVAANAFPIPGNHDRVYSCRPNVFVSGITTATGLGVVLALTPGWGID